MKNHELYLKDPLDYKILNDGVSSNNDEVEATLRYELDTFVCEGAYHEAFRRILQSFLDNISSGVQPSAWISGFYGSGKSHLIKVLRLLWADHPLPGDQATPRSLADLPDDIRELLKSLNTQGRRLGGVHAAGGTLRAGAGHVRERLLGLIFKSVGLPEELHASRFLLDLKRDGHLDALRKDFAARKIDLAAEARKLFTSKPLGEAYLKLHPQLGDASAVAKTLLASYQPARQSDLTIDQTLTLMRLALEREGKIPLTVLVIDEVQQFIGDNTDRAMEVQEIVEACSKKMEGRLLVVGTGQSALHDTPTLQRLMGRFTIRVSLKDNDVEKVVRTVVLRKKETVRSRLQSLLEAHDGEITRQLRGTQLAATPNDREVYVADYPLLPVRRRFWERVLRSSDASATAGQLRTQLRVVFEACKHTALDPIGTVVPADFLFDQISSQLLHANELQRRFMEIIDEQTSKPDGALRRRLCALIFLVNKLPTAGGADTGLRANEEHLGDLLVSNLNTGDPEIRQKIPGLLKLLADEGYLMLVDGEYRLQTSAGAHWEAEYQRRLSALKQNTPALASELTRLLQESVNERVSSVRVTHGRARVRRELLPLYQTERPSASSEGVVVWIRDGYSESDSTVLKDIRGLPTDDGTVHVFIPKPPNEHLRDALAAMRAARETLTALGTPDLDDGKEARRAIESRATLKTGEVKQRLDQILESARVFLSGGSEVGSLGVLETAVEDAAVQVLARIYPRFEDGDNEAWGTVLKRAKEGNANALQAVGHVADPQAHPVTAKILTTVGGGKKGTELRKLFTSAPYGWPQDAVDAALAVLLSSGHLAATLNGRAALLADLDQRTLAQCEYRPQSPVLTVPQKLELRKLFQLASVPIKPGDEAASAAALVQKMLLAATAAGGPPPAPVAPNEPWIFDLQGKSGNDLLFALFALKDELPGRLAAWKTAADTIQQRQREFIQARELLGHAAGLPLADAAQRDLDALEANRSLLQNPNPVQPVLQALYAGLRQSAIEVHQTFATARAQQVARLDAHPVWSGLPSEDRERLLAEAAFTDRPAPAVSSSEALLQSLRASPLATWRSQTDALPTQADKALSAAIRAAEPKAQHLKLPSATLRTPEDFERWLSDVRKVVEPHLKDGPVIL